MENGKDVPTDDSVVAVEEINATKGVAHVVTKGHVLANGIAVSVRVENDIPDPLFNAGVGLYEIIGAPVTSKLVSAWVWLRNNTAII